MSDYEIYETLTKLKEHCKNTGCVNCQLSIGENPYKCAISDNERGKYPKDWIINSPSDYRAFKSN